jgi:two-component system response regulator HydG
VGSDERFVEQLEYVRKIAWTDGPVAITGESGTGKELFARAIHDLSRRAERPFVVVNCGALPAELLESELFGHAKGAFTGAYRNKRGLLEEAVDGTVFLDEIGEMTLPTQAKMLRFLESGEIRRVGDNAAVHYDVRVVCATNRNLREERDAERFRPDLYYRLTVFEIALPPLRERRGDVPLLIEHFREAFAERMGQPMPAFSAEAARKLTAWHWPGNVRQLRNVVERALVVARGAEVTPDDAALDDGPPETAPRDEREAECDAPARRTLAERERDHILEVLERCDGSRKKASAALGISPATLWRRLKSYE